jgi:hypothetical protein
VKIAVASDADVAVGAFGQSLQFLLKIQSMSSASVDVVIHAQSVTITHVENETAALLHALEGQAEAPVNDVPESTTVGANVK